MFIDFSAGVQSGYSKFHAIACQKVNIVDIICVAVAFTLMVMLVAQICKMVTGGGAANPSDGRPERRSERRSDRRPERRPRRASR